MDPREGATDLTPSASRQLLRLYRTSISSRKFEATFEKFHKSDEYEEIIDRLRGPELEAFVNFLDALLEDKNLSTALFQKALYALWNTCGRRGVLPKSYVISEGVSRKDEKKFASGGFADVWRGELVEKNMNRRQVSLKSIKVTVKDGEKGRNDNEKAFYEEVSLWVRLKHPNVVRCFGATAHPHQIVIDWMENGEVMDYLRNNPNASRTHLVLCATRGLDYLHSRGVVHGDVKPQNILVNYQGDACLTDFGLSIVINNNSSGSQYSRARGHSSVWVAPETLIDRRISKEGDVFCYGLVALEIFKGGSPWGRATASQIMTNIALGKRPDRPEGAEPLGLTSGVWNCLMECWHQNPEERITISGVLAFLDPTTRAKGVTLRALDSSRGNALEPTTIRTTDAPRRASGSHHQGSDSYVPSQPGLTALQPLHHHRYATRLDAAASGIGAETSTEKVTASARPNPAPDKEGKSPRRFKRFLRRCMSTASCISDGNVST